MSIFHGIPEPPARLEALEGDALPVDLFRKGDASPRHVQNNMKSNSVSSNISIIEDQKVDVLQKESPAQPVISNKKQISFADTADPSPCVQKITPAFGVNVAPYIAKTKSQLKALTGMLTKREILALKYRDILAQESADRKQAKLIEVEESLKSGKTATISYQNRDFQAGNRALDATLKRGFNFHRLSQDEAENLSLQKSCPSTLPLIVWHWDNASRAKKKRILTELIEKEKGKSADQLDASLQHGSSLLFMRILSFLKLTCTLPDSFVPLQLEALSIFLSSSSQIHQQISLTTVIPSDAVRDIRHESYMNEFVNAGGVMLCLSIINNDSLPHKYRAKALTLLVIIASVDKFALHELEQGWIGRKSAGFGALDMVAEHSSNMQINSNHNHNDIHNIKNNSSISHNLNNASKRPSSPMTSMKQEFLRLTGIKQDNLNVLVVGRQYKQLMCKIGIIPVAIKCITECPEPDVRICAKDLLICLGANNPSNEFMLHEALLEVLSSRASAVSKKIIVQTMRYIVENHPSVIAHQHGSSSSVSRSASPQPVQLQDRNQENLNSNNGHGKCKELNDADIATGVYVAHQDKNYWYRSDSCATSPATGTQLGLQVAEGYEAIRYCEALAKLYHLHDFTLHHEVNEFLKMMILKCEQGDSVLCVLLQLLITKVKKVKAEKTNKKEGVVAAKKDKNGGKSGKSSDTADDNRDSDVKTNNENGDEGDDAAAGGKKDGKKDGKKGGIKGDEKEADYDPDKVVEDNKENNKDKDKADKSDGTDADKNDSSKSARRKSTSSTANGSGSGEGEEGEENLPSRAKEHVSKFIYQLLLLPQLPSSFLVLRPPAKSSYSFPALLSPYQPTKVSPLAVDNPEGRAQLPPHLRSPVPTVYNASTYYHVLTSESWRTLRWDQKLIELGFAPILFEAGLQRAPYELQQAVGNLFVALVQNNDTCQSFLQFRMGPTYYKQFLINSESVWAQLESREIAAMMERARANALNRRNNPGAASGTAPAKAAHASTDTISAAVVFNERTAMQLALEAQMEAICKPMEQLKPKFFTQLDIGRNGTDSSQLSDKLAAIYFSENNNRLGKDNESTSNGFGDATIGSADMSSRSTTNANTNSSSGAVASSNAITNAGIAGPGIDLSAHGFPLEEPVVGEEWFGAKNVTDAPPLYVPYVVVMEADRIKKGLEIAQQMDVSIAGITDVSADTAAANGGKRKNKLILPSDDDSSRAFGRRHLVSNQPVKNVLAESTNTKNISGTLHEDDIIPIDEDAEKYLAIHFAALMRKQGITQLSQELRDKSGDTVQRIIAKPTLNRGDKRTSKRSSVNLPPNAGQKQTRDSSFQSYLLDFMKPHATIDVHESNFSSSSNASGGEHKPGSSHGDHIHGLRDRLQGGANNDDGSMQTSRSVPALTKKTMFFGMGRAAVEGLDQSKGGKIVGGGHDEPESFRESVPRYGLGGKKLLLKEDALAIVKGVQQNELAQSLQQAKLGQLAIIDPRKWNKKNASTDSKNDSTNFRDSTFGGSMMMRMSMMNANRRQEKFSMKPLHNPHAIPGVMDGNQWEVLSFNQAPTEGGKDPLEYGDPTTALIAAGNNIARDLKLEFAVPKTGGPSHSPHTETINSLTNVVSPTNLKSDHGHFVAHPLSRKNINTMSGSTDYISRNSIISAASSSLSSSQGDADGQHTAGTFDPRQSSTFTFASPAATLAMLKEAGLVNKDSNNSNHISSGSGNDHNNRSSFNTYHNTIAPKSIIPENTALTGDEIAKEEQFFRGYYKRMSRALVGLEDKE